jgi:1-deoxy-D-xylulose-5-phosphate reductoisomerase
VTTRVAVAGSTGSIGVQTLDVVAAEADRFEVVALGASSSVDRLIEQARAVRPKVVAIADAAHEARLKDALPECEVRGGPDALASLADDADVVVNGVVGFAGLPVTLATLNGGKRLALANKESLIAAGPVVQIARATPGAELVPVDSEHCAVHQCLRASKTGGGADLARIVLTGERRPFRGRTRADLAQVTIDDALTHPTWSMGPKITVDSSTLMNKGLEVIEAHELFGASYDQIEVVVHPQSIVHSMVEFTDGAMIAQLSLPDMRLPIGYALAYPDRIGTPFGRLDWAATGRLDFEAPDIETFTCLRLAYDAGRVGGTAPAWLNAANEVAVASFLAGEMPWIAIPDVLSEVLSRHDGNSADSVDAVIAADRTARAIADQVIRQRQAA